MAEYRLSYTAAQIDEKLGKVAKHSEDIGTLQENVQAVADDVQVKAEIVTLSTEEYETLEANEATNANTLYMLTDSDEEEYVTETELASKGYLTEQSLAGLATEKYVTDKIAEIPTPDVSGQIEIHNTNLDAHTDIREAISSIVVPTKVSELTNDARYITEQDIAVNFSTDGDGNVQLISLFNSTITHDNNGNVIIA